jgi:hypothetical protein
MDGVATAPFETGATLFTDRAYRLDQRPEAIQGATFFRTKIEGAVAPIGWRPDRPVKHNCILDHSKDRR